MEITLEEALKKFKQEYQDSKVIHHSTSWMGQKALKYPGDAWVYQELISKLRPDYVIETGTAWGGGALFLADMCNNVGRGQVITIEDDKSRYEGITFKRDNLTRLLGSSVSNEIVDKLRVTLEGKTSIVILDSDHSYEHVTKELQIYKDFIRSGFYLIVEDTHMQATHQAVEDFLINDISQSFEVDKGCEKYIMTYNPGGFLRKK